MGPSPTNLYCRDHELPYAGHQRCPLCARGIYPNRTLRAIRDFAEQPWPETVDVPTWQPHIKYSEVVRRLGRELLQIEADRLSRCADLDLQARDLRRRAQQARVDLQALHRAVRILVGYSEERPRLSKMAESYLEVIEHDGINW